MQGEDVEGPTSAGLQPDDTMSTLDMRLRSERKPRPAAAWANHGERFLVKDKGSSLQYGQTYFCRLAQLSPHVKSSVQQKWPGLEVARLLDLVEGKEVAVIGILYKEMKLKANVLDEYTAERGVKGELGRTCLCSDDDRMYLEDCNARIALSGKGLPISELVTGVVLALRGSQQSGCFEVMEVCFPVGAPQPAFPVGSEDKYIAIVSGLSVGSEQPPQALELLTEFLSGALGSEDEKEVAQKIVRVVIAGGMLNSLDMLAKAKPNSREQTRALDPLEDASMLLAEIASSAPVDIIPGKDDPVNFALPQQPMNRKLFGGGGQYSNVTMMTNPSEFDVDGVRILATAGQNIQDLERYSGHSDNLRRMECCLEWRHLAPTAPDTLLCFPFSEQDPFVVQSTPHVFLAGDQPKFETKYVQVHNEHCVRLLCIPNFSKTGQIILLNLKTLKCHPIAFDFSSLM